MKLQNINKVELQGHIGSVRTLVCQGRLVANITVATNFAFKGKNNEWVVDTVWHSVSAWENKKVSRETLESLKKGTPVHIIGRIRNIRFETADGEERISNEIIAYQLEKIEAELSAEEEQ